MVDRYQFAEDVKLLKAANQPAQLESYLKMQLSSIQEYIQFGKTGC